MNQTGLAELNVPERLVRTSQIRVHGPEGFEGMRKAGKIAAACLDMLIPHVQPGVLTDDLDKLAREFTLDHGALPACLFYRGYSKTVCISPNHVVCHGIPGDRALREGDIVNIDVTVIVDGWHGDTSRMYGVGEVSPRARRLVDVTYEALQLGMAAVKPGNRFGDIGAVIQAYAEAQRCSVVRDFCGHGVGQVFHDSPNVLHFGRKGDGEILRPGMFFTIEPMVNLGKPQVKVLSDGWTAVTRDKSLSAQFEHSVGVTETGLEIFTASPLGLDKPPIQGVG
jgi:methionyl aminopeptidase